MILAIGGPTTEKPEKKSGFMKSKAPRKIGGIGGEYMADESDSEGPSMSSEERMLEIARPLARSAGIPSQTVVDVIKGICELTMNSKPNGEAEPAESEEGEE